MPCILNAVVSTADTVLEAHGRGEEGARVTEAVEAAADTEQHRQVASFARAAENRARGREIRPGVPVLAKRADPLP